MTCAEVEQVLPEILDDAPDTAYQNAFDAHLKSCAGCSALVSDLKMISGAAAELADFEEPPSRLWVRIAAELRAEGLIREQAPAPASVVFHPARWNAWWLAPITAALLAAGAYIVSHKEAAPVAKHTAPDRPAVPATTTSASAISSAAPSTSPAAADPLTSTQSAPVETPQPAAIASAKASRAVPPEAASADSDANSEDQEFMSVVSTRAPSMKVTYQAQLAAVNEEIRDVQAYLQQNPGDPDARQQLMDAYQQKALLYQIALDRIQ